MAAVRRAAEENPNWLVLLDRLSPEFAPAGEGRASADHLKVEGAGRVPVSTVTLSAVFVVAAGRRAPARGGADGRSGVRALADVLVELDRVDGRPVDRSADTAPRLFVLTMPVADDLRRRAGSRPAW